jgi:hypothetical protein
MKLFAHRAIETGSRCGRRSAVAGDERTHIVRPLYPPAEGRLAGANVPLI